MLNVTRVPGEVSSGFVVISALGCAHSTPPALLNSKPAQQRPIVALIDSPAAGSIVIDGRARRKFEASVAYTFLELRGRITP